MENAVEFGRRLWSAAESLLPPQSGGQDGLRAWQHNAAALVTVAAYLLIFLEFVYLVRRRRPVPRSAVLYLFGAFILAGCVAHLDPLSARWPAFRPTLTVEACVALISLATAASLLPTIPKLAALRDPGELHREIAQRRRSELELKQFHAQLEGVVEQRTSELAAKNEEMEQFLNIVSHDLKNPVVTCLGLIGMLRTDLKAGSLDGSVDSVERIERAVTRMRQFIEDLLNLSRIGRIPFKQAEVNTLDVVRTVASDLQPRLDEAGATLDVASDLPPVRADARWVMELFENLITNAIKYGCDNPEPRINVGHAIVNAELRFFVGDNGRGIEPADHAKVFEPFRRLRSDREGTGMGLPIVARIVKMHGGRIWIESDAGRGARFWFTLPAADGEANGKAWNGSPLEPITNGSTL